LGTIKFKSTTAITRTKVMRPVKKSFNQTTSYNHTDII
jgi:hypothetical protein